jgi:ABC-type antimicrobial peptide transport system permease subunit
MFKNYFKTAWRNLVKNKSYAFINFLGLAIGLSLCLVIYLVTSFELSYDSFQPDRNRVYRIVSEFQKTSGETQYLSMIPDPLAPAIRREFTGIEEVAQFHNYYAKVSIPWLDETKKFDAAKEKETPSGIVIVDPEYFEIFHYKWLAGNTRALQKPQRVVLTAKESQKYFGNLAYQQVLGRQVMYNDSLPCVVSGIVEDYPVNSAFIFTDFISSSTIPATFLKNTYELDNWQNWASKSQTFVKLQQGISHNQFDRQVIPMIKKYMNDDPSQKTVIQLQPLKDIHFDTRYQDRYSRSVSLSTLYTLMAIAGFVLLIAAINFINLSTAQSIKRAKEIGVRKVLGGSRRSLVIQFLAEAFLVTLLSTIIALFIAPYMLFVFRPFLPSGLTLQINIEAILFIVLIVIITSLLAGLYPAKVLSGYVPALTIKGTVTRTNPSRNYFRQALVVFQFTISILFIIGAIIMGEQVHYALTANMGFQKEAIVNIPVNTAYGTGRMDRLAQLIRQQKAVGMVSVDMSTPFQSSYRGTSLRCPALGGDNIDAQFQTGDENYIKLYQMKLLAGRNLFPSDTMREFIINETCAKKLGFKIPSDAIGKMLHAGTTDAMNVDKEFPVVGVVADFHTQSFHEAIAPVFISTSKKFSSTVSVKLFMQGNAGDNLKKAIAELGQAWKTVYPEENFHFSFFEDSIAKYYKEEIQTSRLIDSAMMLAIFISCMGLFGLAAYTTQQRSKEISIRKVLGASAAGITTSLSKDFVKLVIIAVLIATPIAWWIMNRWLQSFAYRISINWWAFAAAGLAAILIALATVSFQTIKAAIANPVKSLRME